jgi:hypothetical protein
MWLAAVVAVPLVVWTMMVPRPLKRPKGEGRARGAGLSSRSPHRQARDRVSVPLLTGSPGDQVLESTTPPPPVEQPPPSPPALPPKQLARRVFISHTGEDACAKIFAQSVLPLSLKNAGLDVFLDTTGLPPGCDWPATLADAAAHSAVFVAVLVRTGA